MAHSTWNNCLLKISFTPSHIPSRVHWDIVLRAPAQLPGNFWTYISLNFDKTRRADNPLSPLAASDLRTYGTGFRLTGILDFKPALVMELSRLLNPAVPDEASSRCPEASPASWTRMSEAQQIHAVIGTSQSNLAKNLRAIHDPATKEPATNPWSQTIAQRYQVQYHPEVHPLQDDTIREVIDKGDELAEELLDALNDADDVVEAECAFARAFICGATLSEEERLAACYLILVKLVERCVLGFCDDCKYMSARRRKRTIPQDLGVSCMDRFRRVRETLLRVKSVCRQVVLEDHQIAELVHQPLTILSAYLGRDFDVKKWVKPKKKARAPKARAMDGTEQATDAVTVKGSPTAGGKRRTNPDVNDDAVPPKAKRGRPRAKRPSTLDGTGGVPKDAAELQKWRCRVSDTWKSVTEYQFQSSGTTPLLAQLNMGSSSMKSIVEAHKRAQA
ncbi:uncharacterized protein EI97DRAFT_503769 [Westerdykella ornata]|uniref:Uncharacterized protein n=1 Tax=Westerdykella ornata TaxID=318751 RepID=A0A6A6J9N5_WESOR|nr:uncharacterized protein EI97DRAFT_503769 [Westerdykella ornata]KAF2272967.1 hypothetical protein EI97DRAFT_503769 [Westerdykella ornata]